MLILRREHHPSAIWQVLHKTWATLIMLNTSSWILKKSFLWGLIRGALEMILKNSSPYAQVSNILFRKERQNWKPIYSGCPDAPLFNQEKSKLMQTKGQLSKNQSCFFVCTTFDSFLNDLSMIPLYRNHFPEEIDCTKNLFCCDKHYFEETDPQYGHTISLLLDATRIKMVSPTILWLI